jgi:saccharopine dehydrogenase (NAD+, L-lysine forming)
MRRVGIRREDKDSWERRVPLVPHDVERLVRNEHMTIVVQPSDRRIFSEEAFADAGALVDEDLSSCEIVLAVKEIPAAFFRPHTTYVFFSHTHKGQPYNMDMLRRMMELGCSLIDYERITDDQGVRLIAFSRFAGIAGAVDALWALGLRLQWEGMKPNPFVALHPTHFYDSMDAALEAIREAGRRIGTLGLPEALQPFVIGITGYGRVAQGVQEVLDALGAVDVPPDELDALAGAVALRDGVYKSVFHERDMFESKDLARAFDLTEYLERPDSYRSTFAQRLPMLSVLLNGVYWDETYPRLVTRADIRELWARQRRPRLTVIGDISCDLQGSIEITVKETHVGQPFYVIDPQSGAVCDGVAGVGPVVLSVGNLPCEVSREASEAFSAVLSGFVPALARADFAKPTDELELPAELKRALILHGGDFTPDYSYMRKFV